MAEPQLQAQDVVVRYGDVRALDGVSLDVNAGETVALVGESGSGKSTLLKCFNRMVRAAAGTIRVGGSPVREHAPERLRRGLGYVQQEGGLLPHWDVRRNIGLVPGLLGWARERFAARLPELLQTVGLSDDLLDRLPNELSGGQRQRVAIARALAADPPVLLLDEPFGALDPITRAQIQREARGWKERLHKTTLLVTHDVSEAFELGDRIAVMRDGRILQCAAADELRARPADPYVIELLGSFA